MRIFGVATLAALLLFAGASVAAEARTATVYKNPSCGCCENYIRYLRQNGFKVEAVDQEDLDGVKARYGVPKAMQSCHTAIVGGYVVEGHVPVGAINKLLTEKPKTRGIALPGMPADSPGMGQMKPGTLTIYEIAATAGKPKVFSVE